MKTKEELIEELLELQSSLGSCIEKFSEYFEKTSNQLNECKNYANNDKEYDSNAYYVLFSYYRSNLKDAAADIVNILNKQNTLDDEFYTSINANGFLVKALQKIKNTNN